MKLLLIFYNLDVSFMNAVVHLVLIQSKDIIVYLVIELELNSNTKLLKSLALFHLFLIVIHPYMIHT